MDSSSVEKWCACPFYGFALYYNILMDNGTSECALNRNYKCRMKAAKSAPDFKVCTIIPEEEKEKFITHGDEMRVYIPPSIAKDRSECATGITLAEWWNRVMKT